MRLWIKLLFILVVVLLVFFVFVFDPFTSDHDKEAKLSISLSLCLKPEDAFVSLPMTNPARQRYMQNHWLDTTLQFYNKTLILDQVDTLHLSVINGLARRNAVQRIALQSDTVLQRETIHQSIYNCDLFLSKVNGRWMVRYLLSEPPSPGLYLIDVPQDDSSKAWNSYQKRTVLDKVDKCL